MNREEAKRLICKTFENPFDKEFFKKFIINLLKDYDKEKALEPKRGTIITERYRDFISSWERIGRYIDANKKIIDILIIKLKKKDLFIMPVQHKGILLLIICKGN